MHFSEHPVHRKLSLNATRMKKSDGANESLGKFWRIDFVKQHEQRRAICSVEASFSYTRPTYTLCLRKWSNFETV